MDGSLGARGEGSRGHIFAWETTGEGEGKAARSPLRKSKAETAWFGRTSGGGSRRRSGGCCELWNESRSGEESEMGAAGVARAHARPKEQSAGGEGIVGEVGAGTARSVVAENE